MQGRTPMRSIGISNNQETITKILEFVFWNLVFPLLRSGGCRKTLLVIAGLDKLLPQFSSRLGGEKIGTKSGL